MTERKTLFRDVLLFLKNIIDSNLEDPRQGNRSKTSSFIMTSFPDREVQYPLITLEVVNSEQVRAGMQSTRMDIGLEIQIRVWSKSVTQSDRLGEQILDLLAKEQFDSNGSVDNDFHDYNIGASVRVDEPGKGATKSRIIQLNYKFYNL